MICNDLYHFYCMVIQQEYYINHIDNIKFYSEERKQEVLESAKGQLAYFKKQFEKEKTNNTINNFFKM